MNLSVTTAKTLCLVVWFPMVVLKYLSESICPCSIRAEPAYHSVSAYLVLYSNTVSPVNKHIRSLSAT